jgi:hypothetical protein
MKPRYRWQPLRQGVCKPIDQRLVDDLWKTGRYESREKIVADLEREEKATTIWINETYQVQRREMTQPPGLIHLNIRRRDGAPILRDWRHFQQIKNELIGEECEAIELYPAESRKVDASNKYHIWGYADPTWRFPIGMTDRDVDYSDGSTPGTRQRPL